MLSLSLLIVDASPLLARSQTRPPSAPEQKFQRAMAADLADAQYGIGVLKQSKSDWQGSIQYLERAVALKPDDAGAHYHRAIAY